MNKQTKEILTRKILADELKKTCRGDIIVSAVSLLFFGPLGIIFFRDSMQAFIFYLLHLFL